MNMLPIDGLGNAVPVPQVRQSNGTDEPTGKVDNQKSGTEAPADSPAPRDHVDVSTHIASENAEASAERTDALEEEASRVREIAQQLSDRSTVVAFEVQFEEGDYLINVVNRESGEVVRQIPPEEIVRVQEVLEDLRGVLFSEVS